jgi:MazG family protein
VRSLRKNSRPKASKKRLPAVAKSGTAAASAAKPGVHARAHPHTEVAPPSVADRAAGEWFARLVALQERLRAPGGCPWDREQTHESLRKFLVEETYEVLDAMDAEDTKKLASELGDLLLQIVFHSVLARESGRFTISDVIESIHTKMVRRHPHVFGDTKASTSADVLKNWEQLKTEERVEDAKRSGHAKGKPGDASAAAASDGSILGGVPRSLPAVLEASQLTSRAAHIGFDWENLAGILDKLEEEKGELQTVLGATSISAQLVSRSRQQANAAAAAGAAGAEKRDLPARDARRIEEEVGDLLFVTVNIARFLGVDPEVSLKRANRKFKERFEQMEAAAAREGKRLADVPRARMEELWNESKKRATASHGVPPAKSNGD